MQTLDLIAEARFDCAYSFVYSPRPGTPAANLRDTVDIAIKEQRLSILQKRIRQLADEFRQGLVGTTQSILVERPSRRGGGQMAGRTPSNRTGHFDGAASLVGQFVDELMTGGWEHELQGIRPNTGRGGRAPGRRPQPARD